MSIHPEESLRPACDSAHSSRIIAKRQPAIGPAENGFGVILERHDPGPCLSAGRNQNCAEDARWMGNPEPGLRASGIPISLDIITQPRLLSLIFTAKDSPTSLARWCDHPLPQATKRDGGPSMLEQTGRQPSVHESREQPVSLFRLAWHWQSMAAQDADIAFASADTAGDSDPTMSGTRFSLAPPWQHVLYYYALIDWIVFKTRTYISLMTTSWLTRRLPSSTSCASSRCDCSACSPRTTRGRHSLRWATTSRTSPYDIPNYTVKSMSLCSASRP